VTKERKEGNQEFAGYQGCSGYDGCGIVVIYSVMNCKTEGVRRDSDISSVVACVFVAAVKFLPSRCLATIRGFLPSRRLATIGGIYTHTAT
jgi:hypothetical protein